MRKITVIALEATVKILLTRLRRQSKSSRPGDKRKLSRAGYDLADAHEWVVGARLHVSFILSYGTSGRRLAAPLGATSGPRQLLSKAPALLHPGVRTRRQ